MGLVIGKHMKNIVPVQAHRLNSKVIRIREAYIEKLEFLYQEHGVWDKLEEIAELADFPVTPEAVSALEGLNQLTEKLMLWDEKRCRKLNSGHYKFSSQVKEWLDRCHVFRALLRL